jgi:hypothetical protein
MKTTRIGGKQHSKIQDCQTQLAKSLHNAKEFIFSQAIVVRLRWDANAWMPPQYRTELLYQRLCSLTHKGIPESRRC